MVEIKSVSLGSAFKVGAVFSLMLWAIFGLLFVLAPGAFLDTQSTTFSRQAVPTFSESFIVYACGLPIYAIIGGISFGLSAFVYNLAAGFVGGVQVTLSGSEWQAPVQAPFTPISGTSFGNESPESKLKRASGMIQSKQFDDAYKLLQTIRDHPKASEWLDKLENIDPTLPMRHKRKNDENDDWSPVRYD